MELLIAAHKEQDTIDRIKKLNKLTEKLEIMPIEIVSREEVLEELYINRFFIDGRALYEGTDVYPLPCVRLTLSGDAPVFNGWVVVAEVFGNSKEMVCSDDKYMPEKMCCEHCNTNRNRNKTFIIKHTDGTIKQVASSCVKHFVGKDLGEFFSQVELMKSSVEDPERSFDDEQFFKSNMDYCSDVVLANLDKYTFFSEKEIFALWEAQDHSVCNCFLKHRGVPKGTRKHLYEPIYKAQEEQDKKTVHFGEMKKRMDLTVNIIKVEEIPASDGWMPKPATNRYLAAVDGDMTKIVEFYCPAELEGTVKIKGTVANHKHFRERKYTYLNRVKVL
jgi:hypothetical protein